MQLCDKFYEAGLFSASDALLILHMTVLYICRTHIRHHCACRCPAPNGVRPSAATVLTTWLDRIFFSYLRFGKCFSWSDYLKWSTKFRDIAMNFSVNSLSSGRCIRNFIWNDNFCQLIFLIFLWNCTGIDANNLKSIIGSCNGLVPSGNKPLSESWLTRIFVVTSSWCH